MKSNILNIKAGNKCFNNVSKSIRVSWKLINATRVRMIHEIQRAAKKFWR